MDNKENEIENTQYDLCRSALENLSQGDAWNFKSAVENILSAKIVDGIETERFSVGSSMFGDRVVEEEVKSRSSSMEI
jgi:hypothetical protein